MTAGWNLGPELGIAFSGSPHMVLSFGGEDHTERSGAMTICKQVRHRLGGETIMNAHYERSSQ